MEFTLIFDPHVEKELSKLPNELVARIFKKCRQTKGDPMRYWEKNTDREDYRMRVGDYRIIADIDFEDRSDQVRAPG